MIAMKSGLFIVLFIVILAAGGFGAIFVMRDASTLSGTILQVTETAFIVQGENGQRMELPRSEVVSILTESLSGSVSRPSSSMPAKAQPVPETGYPAPVASAQIAVESPYYTIDMEFESRKRVLLYQERAKDPLLSVGLSLVIPGGGHFYTERWGAGVFFFATRAIFTGVTLWGFWTTATEGENDEPVFRMNSPIVGTVGAVGLTTMLILECVDSFSGVNRYNDMLRVRLGIDKVDTQLIPAMPAIVSP